MPTTINTLTHGLREHLVASGSPIGLGHTHQLLAAALGYTSLAVLQASNEPNNLTPSMHWIVDVDQLKERASSLASTFDVGVFIYSLAQASFECHGPKIQSSDDEMAEEFIVEAQDEALDNSGVASKMANTNCTGPWDAYLEFSGSSINAAAQVGDQFEIDYEGQVQGEQDPDRMYFGHQVNVTIQLRFEMAGKRLFNGPPKIEVMGAVLDDEYFSDDDAPSPPSLSELEAIAMELNIPLEKSELFEGADIEPHTTSAGVHVGYLVNIQDCSSSPLIERLREEHPSLQIWVLGTAFERINRFD